MKNDRFKINSPTVVSEIIDGEAVIVNMENGNYYSLDDSGAFLWELICKGSNIEEICGLVDEYYAGSDTAVEPAVSALVNELLKEELIVSIEGGMEAGSSASANLENGQTEARFTSPELKKYTDMDEVLLLDPIHDEEVGQSVASY